MSKLWCRDRWDIVSYLKGIEATGTVKFFSEIAKSLNFTAEHTENAKAPERIIFDNRTQMNADNQDFKYNF